MGKINGDQLLFISYYMTHENFRVTGRKRGKYFTKITSHTLHTSCTLAKYWR